MNRALRTVAIAVLALGCFPASGRDAPLYPTKDCNSYTAQMDLNACANENADAADKALNALYARVMASRTSQADKDGLKQAERSWIRYRDKACKDDVGEQADGGSIWPMEWANCQEAETVKRIRTLQRMLTCTAGVSVCNPH